MQDNITNPMVSNKYKGIPILKIDLTSYMKANNIRGIPIVINKASMVLNEDNLGILCPYIAQDIPKINIGIYN